MNSFELIYSIVKKIPPGKVATYGQIARISGNPRRSRVVGYALHVNPEPGAIPCHRVLNRFGEVSPAFVFGGSDIQRGLLEAEGVEFGKDGRVDLDKYQWRD
jgi:methylated-DNA-protein-cysteine methyltransferase-like protein